MTFRLTLACLAATIPILADRIPDGLIVMIVMYVITQEDTAAMLDRVDPGCRGRYHRCGSSAARLGNFIGDRVAASLLSWLCSSSGDLFLQRVLTIGALGSAIGLAAALAMILPDVYPPDPELLVESVLWIWWCVILGLSVNLGVQLLLSRGDPLTLLERELDTRLQAVAQLSPSPRRQRCNGASALPRCLHLLSPACPGLLRS